jgi:hypothetical protein
MIKSHPQTQLLFKKFQACYKLGVGVSLFPPNHSNPTNPFDQVLAREGRPERFEDIAILAPRKIPYQRRTFSDREVSIGVVLRGPQSEYGIDRCLSGKADGIIKEVTETIIAERGGQIVKIENRLRKSGLLLTKSKRNTATVT